MSTLHSFPSQPLEHSDDHSHFFTNSDDETASQRSISLSSGPSSPKLHGHFGSPSSTIQTPTTSSFFLQLSFTSCLLTGHPSDIFPLSVRKASNPVTDPEINSIAEAGTSGPSSRVNSFKFDEDHTRQPSVSSGSFFSDQEEVARRQDPTVNAVGDNTYPPLSQIISGSHDPDSQYTKNRRPTDIESLSSAATGSSSGTGGRKTRPESMLVEPLDGPLVLGVALVDFNHVVSVFAIYSTFSSA